MLFCKFAIVCIVGVTICYTAQGCGLSQYRKPEFNGVTDFGICGKNVSDDTGGGPPRLGRPRPKWWSEARFGFFIHWGLYSVWQKGEWAYYTAVRQQDNGGPVPGDDPDYGDLLADFRNKFGVEFSDAAYIDQLAPRLEAAVENFDAEKMADAIERSGAKYVVLTAKHHDGWPMWPTKHIHPRRSKSPYQGLSRDVIGELANAVRARNIEFGLYYSGGRDWAYPRSNADPPNPGDNTMDMGEVNDPSYVELADAHVRELIERYRPAILWSDGGWPPCDDSKWPRLQSLFETYYEACPLYVINDRFQCDHERVRAKYTGYKGDYLEAEDPRSATSPDSVLKDAGELCMGTQGTDYGWWGYWPEKGYKDAADRLGFILQYAAMNQNTLLNIGPMPNGSFDEQAMRLISYIGDWFKCNGEAIYGSVSMSATGTKFQKDPYSGASSPPYKMQSVEKGYGYYIMKDSMTIPAEAEEVLTMNGPVELESGSVPKGAAIAPPYTVFRSKLP